MADQSVTYVKFGRDGQLIEREAATPSDHVQFRGTGWVEKDSAAGKRVVSPKKNDDVSKVPATSGTLHAAVAQAGSGSPSGTADKPTTSTTPKS